MTSSVMIPSGAIVGNGFHKMKGFREENRLLVYLVNVFGLYMKSIEALTSSKFLIAFFSVWTKIPVSIFPVYILWDLRSLFFDRSSIIEKVALGRKIIAFCDFYFKNIMFYLYRDKIENLIDLWDNSFQEEFFPEALAVNRKDNLKRNKLLIRVPLLLAFLASIIYCFPAYFSKSKTLLHPSGIIYPHRSPEFEIVVTFDVVASLGCVSPTAFDCILIIFLSHVRYKLAFLRDTLTHMINELVIDDHGRLLSRKPRPQHTQVDEGFDCTNLDENGYDVGIYAETKFKSEEWKRNVKEFENKLRIWILHHQQTIGFFEEVKKVYSSIATVQLVYTVSYTALTALHVVQMKSPIVALGIGIAASSNLMSLFVLCKLGAEVQETHLFDEAFGRAWFLYPKKIKTVFSYIIMRCKKPLTLYGMTIYSINLFTFFEIMRLTYQFFAFMAHMMD